MAIFKQVLGFIMLFAFIGFMGYKLQQNLAGMGNDSNSGLFVAFVVVIVLIIIMLIRRILTYE